MGFKRHHISKKKKLKKKGSIPKNKLKRFNGAFGSNIFQYSNRVFIQKPGTRSMRNKTHMPVEYCSECGLNFKVHSFQRRNQSWQKKFF